MFIDMQKSDKRSGDACLRLRVVIRGAVQGVGFRPYIYRLATEIGLNGWVINSSQGVFIEVEGSRPKLDSFLLRIEKEKPPLSFIRSLESSYLDAVGFETFEVRASDESGEKTVIVLPDIATCPDCLGEIFDPGDRRYLYPFTNCTNCGPRFSIIEALPYDRPNTSMKIFPMCDECKAEYTDPADRRFHAQPNACPKCGPHLELWEEDGGTLAEGQEALLQAAGAIRDGRIVAVKGLGGFHLMVDASNQDAVEELRRRKHREEKPLALMYPSLDAVKADCEVSPVEERLLTSPESPIVLLKRRKAESRIPGNVAPGNPYLGAMLPYSPLHHILMAELGFPIVATSGNLSDEPICIDEREALERLRGIADLFLVHNRPIVRHVDDSIVRVMMGREMVLRRARGYAPLPVHLKYKLPMMMAVGAHLKNCIAASVGEEIFISQHIGDLETTQANDAFLNVINDFNNLYQLRHECMACDAHPDYSSTHYARSRREPESVQHHYAHVLSCMAENEIDAPVLGVSWDGTGYGVDGTIWGGEFLLVDEEAYSRAGHFRTFMLPGGEKAVKEPRRVAMGVLYEIFGDAVFDMKELHPVRAFSDEELGVVREMLGKGLNSPVTSSAGRLFDAVSSLAGLRQVMRFEGQAAMELEFALDGYCANEGYPFALDIPKDGDVDTPMVFDWEPMIKAIIIDVRNEMPVGLISARYHNTLVEMIVRMAGEVGEEKVALTGGCFQNKYLTERAVGRLREAGFRPYWHQRVPPNDGGIALGQIIAASRCLGKK